MKKKLILNITEMDKIYQLEKYGKITFVDDYISVVFIEVEASMIPTIQNLPFVSGIEESGMGSLLTI